MSTADLLILAVVVLADKAAYWSLLFFGKVRQSSPSGQGNGQRGRRDSARSDAAASDSAAGGTP